MSGTAMSGTAGAPTAATRTAATRTAVTGTAVTGTAVAGTAVTGTAAPATRRSRSACRAAAFAALLVGLAAPPLAASARAQPPPAQPRAPAWSKAVMAARQRAAYKLFEEARQDRDAGMIGKAADEYREALGYWDDPIIRYDLALVLIELRDPVAAFEHLDTLLQSGPRVLADERVRAHAAMMRQRLLDHELATLVVTCWTNGARITVDNDEARAWVIQTRAAAARPALITRQVRVRAGLHTIIAELPDGRLVPERRRVRPGAAVHVTLAAPPPRMRRRWEDMTWAPWAVASTGLAFWVAGSALQRSALQLLDSAASRLDECTRDSESCLPDETIRLYNRAREQRMLGLVAYGLSGAAVVAGGVLAYLNRRVPEPPGATARRAAATRPRWRDTGVAPLVGHGFGGALVTGRF
jgi:hypothetical protein